MNLFDITTVYISRRGYTVIDITLRSFIKVEKASGDSSWSPAFSAPSAINAVVSFSEYDKTAWILHSDEKVALIRFDSISDSAMRHLGGKALDLGTEFGRRVVLGLLERVHAAMPRGDSSYKFTPTEIECLSERIQKGPYLNPGLAYSTHHITRIGEGLTELAALFEAHGQIIIPVFITLHRNEKEIDREPDRYTSYIRGYENMKPYQYPTIYEIDPERDIIRDLLDVLAL